MECIRDNVNFMSDFCLTNDFPEDSGCLRYHEKTELYSNIAGAWCIINAVIGFCGNLLTLTAIPYAAMSNKFSLELRSPTTIFTLNLAFADFSYCAINLPLYAVQYLNGHWPGNSASCKANAAFRYLIAFAAWMSVAMIAVSRCATLTCPKYGKKLFSGWSGLSIAILIWVYSNVMLTPIYTKWIGEFGYNCIYGKCDFIPLKNSTFHPRVILFSIGFLLPGILTLTSYLIIGCFIFSRPEVNALRRVGTSDLRKLLNKREKRLAKALLTVCFCYFLFVLPMTVMNLLPLDPTKSIEELEVTYLALFCLYWLQYSANFMIYAARCDQYQKAYIYLLRSLKNYFFGTSQWKTTTTFLVVNQRMLPEIFSQVEQLNSHLFHQDMASAILESISVANQSFQKCGESSAVIILTKRERLNWRFGSQRPKTSCYDESCIIRFGHHLTVRDESHHPMARNRSMKAPKDWRQEHNTRRRSSI